MVEMRLLDSGAADFRAQLEVLKRRGRDLDPAIVDRTRSLIAAVRREGDPALFDAIERFDGCKLTSGDLRMPRAELGRIAQRCPSDVRRALVRMKHNLERFHERQLTTGYRVSDGGLECELRLAPLQAVGMYVPGGRAAYPSTVLMIAVPARLARVPRLAAATPPLGLSDHPAVAAALEIAEVDEVYRMGGAHAIAALAIGTESVARVDKIAGPGNAYVACAKRLLSDEVGIDLVAGPSEVVVMADASAQAAVIALDLLAQAEHDAHASAMLVTPDRALALAVVSEVARRAATSPRKYVLEASLAQWSAAIVTRDLAEAIAVVNEIAPEHLGLHVRDAEAVLAQPLFAGSIFVGQHAPEVLGDYLAGTNHVLPTSGSARWSSPLGVWDFVKRQNVIRCSAAAFADLAQDLACLARSEGLVHHALAAEQRQGAQDERA